MSGVRVCPHCGAMQDRRAAAHCWLCLLLPDASAPVAPAPAFGPPEGGLEEKATAAALVAGLVSIGLGGLLISAGFGGLLTLIVVLPVAWILGEMMLSGPRSAAPAPLRVKAIPAPPPRTEPTWLGVARILGAVAAVVILIPLTLVLALGLCCAFVLGAGSLGLN